jgi:hypothetical protein
MKTIEPVQVWYNGQEVNATVLNAYASDVQLNVSANFYYTLFIVNEYNYINQVNSGMLIMDGQAYQDWDQDSFAWDWVASKLNLTITGEYVPNIPPSPTPIPVRTTTTEAPATTTTTTEAPIVEAPIA